MRYFRLFTLLSFAVIASACDEQFLLLNSGSRLSNTEWIISEWHANSSSCCTFDPYNDVSYSSYNVIFDEMLGLNDYSNDITRLSFYHDNTFTISRGGRVVLRGDFKMYSNQLVLYSYSDRLEFDIVREQSNMLVLYTYGENSFRDVEVVFRRI
jgi:hypothetical protein